MGKLRAFSVVTRSVVLLWLSIFAVIPLLLILGLSFLTPGQHVLFHWKLTLSNYVHLIDPLYGKIALQSVWLATVTTFFCLLIGFPMAYFIAQMNKRYQSFALLMLIIPFWTSSLIRTYAMMALVKTKGLINAALLALGIIHHPILMLYTNTAMLIGLSYNLLPYMILPLYSNFEKLDQRVFDAARDLGASRWRIFHSITLPLTMPGIVMGVLFVFLPATTIFYIPDLLGGARGVLLGNLVKEQFVTMSNWPGGAATSVILTGILMLMVGFYRSRARRGQLQELV